MGLKRKTAQRIAEPPSPSRLAKFSADDLYLLLETSLMQASTDLSKFRTAPEQDRYALLAWIQSSVTQADAALLELSKRL